MDTDALPVASANPPDGPMADSDITLRTAVVGVLWSSGYASVRALHCRVRGGEVVLTGTVPCYYYKQVAQEAVMTVPGVHCLKNLVTVQPPSAPGLAPEQVGFGPDASLD
jgi:hypothetical protein